MVDHLRKRLPPRPLAAFFFFLSSSAGDSAATLSLLWLSTSSVTVHRRTTSMGSASRSFAFSLFLLLLLLAELSPPRAAASAGVDVTLDSASFSIQSLTLLGDAYLRNGSIGLTREAGVPSSGAGAALYNVPVRFYDPTANTSASFSTKFSFSIANPDPGSAGDGLTFFISPSNDTLGDTGAYLGIFDSSHPAKAAAAAVVAVEFDTVLDAGVGDISSNHVGLDVGGPASVAAADLGPFGIDLKNGSLITAWIDYDNHQKSLDVWLSYTDSKPRTPVLSAPSDLSENFQGFMFLYVGFSASTEGSTEQHTVHEWSFRTSGFPEVKNQTTRIIQNVSDEAWKVIPEIPINPSSASTETTDRGAGKKLVGLGLGIASLAAFCLAFSALVWILLKKLVGAGRSGRESFALELLRGPREISYRELSVATRGFHGGRIVGNGSFGSVYKAVDPQTGLSYAVKRSKHSRQGKSEFLAELSVIARLRHKNLVQLRGWCTEKEELLLVYEYMPNGSLDKVLYEPGGAAALQWRRRYNILAGVAAVLVYLHGECEQQVIHRDVKTSNIMLDADFNARLGDFGLARLMDHDQSPVSTLTAGTMGYLAPEYVQCGTATEKTDVFSFGVVVLEICCGRRPIEKHDGDAHGLVNLVDWVWRLYSENRLVEAADRRLSGEFEEGEMKRVLLVGLSCVNPNSDERPTMRRVLQVLRSEAEPLPVPRTKPVPVFRSCSLPLSLQDIVDDGDESSSAAARSDLLR